MLRNDSICKYIPCFLKNKFSTKRFTVLCDMSGFLRSRPRILPWTKSISDELDINAHVIASQLSGHCDVISNRLWRHQQNVNRASETRDRCVKIIVFIVIYGFVMPCKKRNNVHPCEKVIGMFFQHRIWSRLLDINRLCLVCIKRSTEEVKKCQISKRGYQQGPSVETLKKAPCQFCDDKFGHRIMEAVGFFDYEMLNFTQITFKFHKQVKQRCCLMIFWYYFA